MKRLLHILILVAFSVSTFADEVSLRVSAPSTVEVGGKFRVQFTVNTQNVSHFSAPDFKGFEVIYGPATSSQSSFQMINGRTSQSSSIIYTYVLLAGNSGTFTIGSASVQVDGKTVKSKPVQVRVLSGGAGGAGGSSNGGSSNGGGNYGGGQSSSAPSASSSNISAKDLFMTATASRTSVHEQEAILLTYKIYTLVDLTQLDGKLPTLDGFQIQEIPLPRTKEFSIEQYNGRNYRTVTWSQYLLFPQKSGKLTIPSITYEGVVITRNRNLDPIEAFFNGQSGYSEVKRKITTPTLTINVSPLPNKPEGFSGAVGKFSVSSSISTKEVDANEAVTLKISVQGSGNMKLISTPEVQFPKDFETYDAKVNDNFQLTRSGLSGSKDFEYLFVPRHPGTYEIPASEFIYFDTESRSYKTIKTEAYTLKVNKGKGGAGQSVSNYSGQQQDVQQLNQDIRFIKKGDVDLHQPGDTFFGTWKCWAAYILPFLLFVIAMVLGRKQMKANANVAHLRGKKANKVALKRMKTAKKLLDAHDTGKFYDEVLRALWGYVGDKFNMSQESLNKENIEQSLTSRQVPDEQIQQFMKVLNDCEFARYAPGDVNENMENVYNSAISAISKMEDNL
ncbi:MAG: BatD family protein [Bacteroidales bacterium]|nr:protein BatD [Bacteroidaceae bacterium]MDO4201298.1 BatD family protein [Bacteroidales bacterium]